MTVNIEERQPRLNVPHHVAVVMDGNGRWAKQRMLPRLAGHKAGVSSVRNVIRAAAKAGVAHLTLFAFSSENWNRPAQEVEGLMSLFMTALTREIEELHKVGVRLRIVGDLSRLSPELQDKIQAAHAITADNKGLTVNVCVNYGGRWDILEACRKAIQSGIAAQDLDEKTFSSLVQIPDAGDVDLFIRTSGERRISNFLLWQSAYAEMFFTKTFWPDFSEADFFDALDWYSHRERRFGKTSEQLEEN